MFRENNGNGREETELRVRREKIFEEMFSEPLSMSVINEESVDQVSDTTLHKIGKDSSTTERTKDTQKDGELEGKSSNKKEIESLMMNISEISLNPSCIDLNKSESDKSSSIDLNKDIFDLDDMISFKNISDQTFIDLNISDSSKSEYFTCQSNTTSIDSLYKETIGKPRPNYRKFSDIFDSD
jgi:hypothetical protein